MDPVYGEMLKYHVQHFRQEALLLGVGVALVLAFFLSYLPMKRVRRPDLYQSEDNPQPETWREAWSFVPWILVLVSAGLLTFTITMVVLKSIYPPNY